MLDAETDGEPTELFEPTEDTLGDCEIRADEEKLAEAEVDFEDDVDLEKGGDFVPVWEIGGVRDSDDDTEVVRERLGDAEFEGHDDTV